MSDCPKCLEIPGYEFHTCNKVDAEQASSGSSKLLPCPFCGSNDISEGEALSERNGKHYKQTGCAESDATAHPVDTLVTCAELKHICDTVVELTKVRAAGCSHLAIENFAPELMAKLLAELSKHKKGMMRLYTSDLERI